MTSTSSSSETLEYEIRMIHVLRNVCNVDFNQFLHNETALMLERRRFVSRPRQAISQAIHYPKFNELQTFYVINT